MLDMQKQEREGVTVVSLRGEAGMAEAQELTAYIINIAASRPPRLVFDLSGLTFISSLALGELASLAAALQRFECHLGIAGATPLTRTALRRARLDKAYELYDTADAAIAELNNQPQPWFISRRPATGRAPAAS